MVLDQLARGEIHLTGLVLLRDHLTESNHVELLAAARHKSKREIQELIAARFPRPDVPARIRRLPTRKVSLPGAAPGAHGAEDSANDVAFGANPGSGTPPAGNGLESDPRPSAPPAGNEPGDDSTAGGGAWFAPPASDDLATRGVVVRDAASDVVKDVSGGRVDGGMPPGKIEPLSPARFRLQLTASQSFKDKLERARELLAHSCPSGDLADVLERALDALLVDLERSRRAKVSRKVREETRALSKKAVAVTATSSDRPAIPRAVRRAVFERDGDQCTFVGPDGRRCSARAFLEVDHVHPRALGGSHSPANLRVLCRAHNRLAAEQAFGREHVERHLRWQKEPRAAEPPGNAHGFFRSWPQSVSADEESMLQLGPSVLVPGS